jgi:dTDP-4-amino-4,6-dideoxygalactose transaminase
MCAHLEPAYRQEPWRCEGQHGHDAGAAGCALAQSEEISADGLILPLYDEMTDEDQARVVTSLALAIKEEDRRLCP